MPVPENIVHNRKPTLCGCSVSELLQDCPNCDNFILHCCVCNKEPLRTPPDSQVATPCNHYYHVIFTGGSCTNNGRRQAKAGMGAAHGKDDSNQRSIPITDDLDNFPVRSNQRAELCAAKLGLEFLAHGELRIDTKTFIIATDSEYVVKGMTEWLPTWRKNDWGTSKGTKPVNLDLFLDIDSLVKTQETNGVAVGFWHIPKEYNELADRLAKKAAQHGDGAGTKT